MFQRLHHASIEVRTRCSFMRTYPSSRSVAYIHVSSAKRDSWTHRVWGVSFMCKLYSVGTRTEPCGTPVSVSLNFLWDRYEPIRFTKLIESCNFDNLYNNPVCHFVSKAFCMSKNNAAVDMIKFRVV
jgi:hypothetical protein